MKFVLMMIMCSYVQNFCTESISFSNTYLDWNQCMIAGMEKSIQFSKSLGTDIINENLVFFKYYCQSIT